MKSNNSEILLVIAPHPDDEIIGCGGLIKKIKDEGGKVFVLFLTNGDTNDFSDSGFSSKDTRNKEIEKVAEFMMYDGYDIAFEGNEYHLQLDKLGQLPIMEMIERKSKVAIQKIKPTIVAFPSPNSYNQDHRAAALATHASLRPSTAGIKHLVKKVLTYEEAVDFWSLQNKQCANYFITLTKSQINAKLTALRYYKSQDRPFPNLRSRKTLKSLAILRGGEIGVEYAEAFNILRMLY